MSSEAATLVAVFIIVTSIIIVVMRLSKGRMQAKEDELRKSALLRGWTFDAKLDGGYRIHRFSGITDGVAWEAESAKLVAGGNRRERRRHIARWHGKWPSGVSAPIVGMGVPKGKEVMGTTIAAGDGFFARLAQQAAGMMFDKAIDIYFGKEIGEQIDRMEQIRQIDELEQFIKAGVGLTRAFRFGRPA